MISTDILRWCILPYLRVDDAAGCFGMSRVEAAWVVAQCSYKFPHGKVRGMNGDRLWYRNGKKHRADGPASIHMGYGGEEREWWYNGQRHRVSGPAIDHDAWDDKGFKAWFWLGCMHRDDGGPALEDDRGTKKWYQFNRLHRLDGPAIISDDGERQEWWRDGQRHRDDGPACMNTCTMIYSWWVNGKFIKDNRHR